jgi:hypothetical protein
MIDSLLECGFDDLDFWCFNATFNNVNDNKGCTRLAAASDKVYQLLAHGRWFSPGTPASSITKTGRHDIAIRVSTFNQR